MFLILLFMLVFFVSVLIAFEFVFNKKRWYKELNKIMWLISALFVLVPVIYFIMALVNSKRSAYYANLATIFSSIVTSLAFVVGLSVVSQYLIRKSDTSEDSLSDRLDAMTKNINEMKIKNQKEYEEWSDKTKD